MNSLLQKISSKCLFACVCACLCVRACVFRTRAFTGCDLFFSIKLIEIVFVYCLFIVCLLFLFIFLFQSFFLLYSFFSIHFDFQVRVQAAPFPCLPLSPSPSSTTTIHPATNRSTINHSNIPPSNLLLFLLLASTRTIPQTSQSMSIPTFPLRSPATDCSCTLQC